MNVRLARVAPCFFLLAAATACGGRLAAVDRNDGPDAAAAPDGTTPADARSALHGKLLVTVTDGRGLGRLRSVLVGPRGLSQTSTLSAEGAWSGGVWSPDGFHVAYTTYAAANGSSLHVANADGSHDVVLTTDPGTTAGAPPSWWYGDMVLTQDSVWYAEAALSRIVRLPVAGGIARDVWTAPAGTPATYVQSFVRSADGARLAFAMGPALEIYVLDTRTYQAHAVPLSSSPPLGFDGSGERIVFVTGDGALRSALLDGSDPRLERAADPSTQFATLAEPFVLGCSGAGPLPHCATIRAARLGSSEAWIDLGELDTSGGPAGGSASVGMWSP